MEYFSNIYSEMMRLRVKNEVSLSYLEQTNLLLDGFIISNTIIDKTLNRYFKRAPIAYFCMFCVIIENCFQTVG